MALIGDKAEDSIPPYISYSMCSFLNRASKEGPLFDLVVVKGIILPEMEKGMNPPPYVFNGSGRGTVQPPPAAPPSYSQAVGGVGPSSPYTPQYSPTSGPQIVTTVVPVGPQPTHMICPSCHAEIDTETKTKPGLIAMISGFIILLVGCFCGCCLIPCCIESCMDVHHTCPNCSAYLGRYRR